MILNVMTHKRFIGSDSEFGVYFSRDIRHDLPEWLTPWIEQRQWGGQSRHPARSTPYPPNR